MAEVAPVAVPNAPSAVPANVAPAAPATATATKAPEAGATTETPFLEVVVDGQKRKFTEAEARRLLSKAGYADKTVQQAKEAIKAAQQLKAERESEKERAKANLEEHLRSLGVDPDAFAKSRLERHITDAQMSPEQRELAKERAEKAELTKKLNAVEEEKSKATKEQSHRHLQQKLENELADAASAAGIPKDGNGFYAVYAALKDAVESGLPYDAQHIVSVAKQNLESAKSGLKQAVLSDMDGAALEEMLGGPNVDKLIRHRMEKRRGGVSTRTAPPANGSTSGTAAPASEYITRDQLRDKVRKMGVG